MFETAESLIDHYFGEAHVKDWKDYRIAQELSPEKRATKRSQSLDSSKESAELRKKASGPSKEETGKTRMEKRAGRICTWMVPNVDNTTETSICGHWCNDITALQVHYGVHVKTLKEQGTNIICSTKRPKFNTSPRVKSDLEGHDHGRTISTEEAMRFKNWQADSELGQEFQEKAIRYLASLDHCNMLDLVDAV